MNLFNLLRHSARASLKKISGIWLCLCLCACSSLPVKHFPLAPATGEAQVVQQQWQLSYRQAHYSLQVIIESAPDHWQWIAINNLGQRLATATQEKGVLRIRQEQSHPANQLLPELLQAMQFSYWPLQDLQQQGAPQWRFETAARHRDIYFRDILHATIDYESNDSLWQGKLSYDNKDSNFQLVIESQRLN